MRLDSTRLRPPELAAVDARTGTVRVYARLASLVTRALAQSFPLDLMMSFMKKVIPDYDLYERSGFPPNIPMPRTDAARQIMRDVIREGYFPKLVETLIEIDREGVMGRAVPIQFLPAIISEVEAQGYQYDPEYGLFVESEGRKKTRGWGTLIEGRTYELSFLKTDIVGNSRLVRRNPPKLIATAYAEVQRLTRRIIESRNGRIWSWEGDGGLAAFYFSDKNVHATLCAIELIHELFIYNHLHCPLKEPIRLRIAVHTGPCLFVNAPTGVHSETLLTVGQMEAAATEPDSVTVSSGVYTDLGGKLAKLFTPFSTPDGKTLYRYRLEWEQTA